MLPAEAYESNGLTIRPRERLVEFRGHQLDLTPREYEIVLRLVEHPGWVFSAEQLSTAEEEDDYSPESVSVLISRLRRKLDAVEAPDLVETVRGFGYRFHPSGCPPDSAERQEDDHGSHLRDAVWRLHERALDIEREGSPAQIRAATETLESALEALES